MAKRLFAFISGPPKYLQKKKKKKKEAEEGASSDKIYRNLASLDNIPHIRTLYYHTQLSLPRYKQGPRLLLLTAVATTLPAKFLAMSACHGVYRVTKSGSWLIPPPPVAASVKIIRLSLLLPLTVVLDELTSLHHFVHTLRVSPCLL